LGWGTSVRTLSSEVRDSTGTVSVELVNGVCSSGW
jgi:hypothetical protein